MKKFLTIIALLTTVATPALAQSFNPSMGTGNQLPFAYAPHNSGNSGNSGRGHSAFAQAPEASTERNTIVAAPADNHGNLGGSVVNGYVYDGY
jgi:hypothetical protein